MTDAAATDLTPVQLPAKTVAPPPTISAAAQAALSAGAATPRMSRPDPADLAGWRQAVKDSDAMWNQVADGMLAGCTARVETRVLAGITVYDATPAEDPGDGRIYLYIHGGAFVFGGGRVALAFGAANAMETGIHTISVDYRMPPDHPFPAAPQDCLAVYRALIETHAPAKIVIGGVSAGGNLAAATILMIRDQGLPSPAAAILLTPEVDLTEAGDTFRTNAELDTVLKGGLPDCNALYAGGHDLADPYVSPLFGDFSKGFPPTLIQSGTRDLFLSNSVLMHRKLRRAGIDAELHVWEAMPHGGFGFTAPEDDEITEQFLKFIDKHAA